MSRSRRLGVLLVCLLASACAIFPRRVRLNYTPSKNVERRGRQTRLQITPFLDRRQNPRNFGKASVFLELGAQPIKPWGEPAAWVTQSAIAELASAGYESPPKAEWKVGGALRDVFCGSGKRTICVVKIEAWVTMKEGWQVLKKEYQGEGIRPPLFGEDPYELSLEEALREALGAFRKDVERLVP